MKQTHGKSRYLSTILILMTMIFTVSDLNKTGLQTKVSAKVSKETAVSKMDNTPVYFEENKGQFNDKVKYFIRGTNGYSLFLTATDAVYVLSSREQETERRGSTIYPFSGPEIELKTPKPSKRVAVFMTLAGANGNSEFSGSQLLENRTNYFRGSDETKWQTDIPNYQSVRADQIYDGIDIIWHGKEKGSVQYDFVVQPNANPNQIEWKIQGARDIELTAEGDLLIKTEYGDIKQNKPFTYQEINGLRGEVQSAFIIEAREEAGQTSFHIKFEVGSYDEDNSLIIDPTVNSGNLAFSTFLGGDESDWGNAIATDVAGNVFIAGRTGSLSFPTTPGTFDTTHNSENFTDVFVTKLNATGSALIYSTFIGGSYSDDPYDMAVDSSGNVFLVGETRDHPVVDYPTTAGAFDTTHNGSFDVFVTKLNPTGSALIYSTFLGGSAWDRAGGLAVDAAGNAYVTGFTDDGAIDFPITAGAFDTTHNGFQDAFVTKLNATGSALIYSTFIGSSGHEGGWKIAVDSSGNAFLTGSAYQNGIYPTTEGAFDTTHNGAYDAFVTKLNFSGSSLIYSTFIGGSDWDATSGIAVDPSGNVFVTGETGSDDFPTTSEAFDTTFNGGLYDVFVTKLSATGSELKYSTYIGGSSDDQGTDIEIDSSGNAFLTGETLDAVMTDYPTTPGAFDTTHNGNRDGFVTKLNSTGSRLLYSSFIGGSSSDGGSAITIDSSGNIFLTGPAHSAGFPTTAGAFDTTYNGVADAFVTKFNTSSASPPQFDFDGDGKTDIGIFRPAAGEWWIHQSSNGSTFALQFGAPTDRIAPSDYTGDGKADVAVWRPSSGEWFVLRSEDFSFFAFPFGTNGDIPAPADFDNDGKADPAVFRPSTATWFIQRSSDNGTTIAQFGANGDVPVAADYDGDGRADIAIYRPSLGQWWLNRSSLGVIAMAFGVSADNPVQGDFTGDGKADVAFWRPSTGEWYILRSENMSFYSVPFGTSTDIPAPGDYDGDGKSDTAVFRPSTATWFIDRSTAGTLIQQFGANGDRPVPNAYVP